MTMIAQMHIALEIWGCIFSVITAVTLYVSKGIKYKENKALLHIFIANALILVSDSLAWMFRGNPSQLGFYMVRISNYLVFILEFVLLWRFADYVNVSINQRHIVKIKLINLIKAIAVLGMIMVTVSQFTNLYYYFDENNFYHRNTWFPISQIWGIVGILILFYIVIKHRKSLSQMEFISLLTYMFFPVVALAIQIWFYGIALLNIANTISILMLFFATQVERSKTLVKQEQELTNAKIDTMISQIQPHFLYNSLAAIKGLCNEDPKKARKAIEDFSFFLRGNMESISTNHPIPFMQELEHVKNYLSLELIRFEDRLKIEYDVEHSNFWIPPLTVQPIVENAVKYCTLGKSDITTVKITTDKDKHYDYVTIEDNGVGFDINEQKNDGRRHVGIENVKKRLNLMCNGKLEITSVVGKGTNVRICIPKIEGK